MTMFKVEKKRLEGLLETEQELIAMEAAGVDNWVGYNDYDIDEINLADYVAIDETSDINLADFVDIDVRLEQSVMNVE